MKKKMFLVLVAGLVLPLLLSGCSLTGKSTDESVDSGDNGTVADDASQTAGGGEELPDGFPEDVYVYGDAEITSVSPVDVSGFSNITYVVDEKMSDVVDMYISEMEKDGWTKSSQIESSINDNAVTYLGFTKGEDRHVDLTITDANVTVAEGEDSSGSTVGLGYK